MKKRMIGIALCLILILSCLPGYAASGWAEAELSEARAARLIPEELDLDFTEIVSRAEFSRLAVVFLARVWDTEPEYLLPELSESPFTDTRDPYVLAAYLLGVVEGKGEGSFDPESGLTRQEAAKVLSELYLLIGDMLTDGSPTYSDTAAIAPWAWESVGRMQASGIMQGIEDNRFAPQEGYTAEQSVITLWRLLVRFRAEREQEADMEQQNPPIQSMLTVTDGRLTADGQEVILNGVNLGGWLLFESWMSPILDPTEDLAHSDIAAILTRRFGKERAEALLTQYADNFITEADFVRIAALGFNCVRIPFWYQNFMDASGNWLTETPDTNPGFRRLDWALEQCRANGLYAVLDMHGCPGGQSTNHSTGEKGRCALYRDEAQLAAMERLWTVIAGRYRDTACVAAYDVMNEPQNNADTSRIGLYQAGTPQAAAQTNAVYARMVKAIRRADPNHIVSVEGIWSMGVLPDPSRYDWSNMLYQLHIYDRTPEAIADRVREMADARDRWGVAVYAGEYNSGELEGYILALFRKYGISRTKWTYKTVGRDGDNWGLYNKSLTKVDLEHASYEELAETFGAAMLTENGFVLNREEYSAIR